MKNAVTSFPAPSQVKLGGLLGEALDANRRGRLSHFIEDQHSPAISPCSAPRTNAAIMRATGMASTPANGSMPPPAPPTAAPIRL
jgi:hypothetical protein